MRYILAIVLFAVVCSPPMTWHESHPGTASLQEVIRKLQILDGEMAEEQLSFPQAFRKAVSSMQSAAGLRILYNQKQSESADTALILLVIKPSYTLPHTEGLHIPLPASSQNPVYVPRIYQSIFHPPDTPPPNVS